MSAEGSIELIVRIDAGRTQLLSPGVGIFSAALRESTIVAPGQFAGVLATLDKRTRLVVPLEVHGVVCSKPPVKLRAPVGYGQVLYELTAAGPAEAPAAEKIAARAESGGDLSLRSPQSGRFYHRSTPGEPSLCEVGRELEIGTPIGLIEVMKTFTQVIYRAERGLPTHARIVSVIARDGADIDEGAALILVEPR